MLIRYKVLFNFVLIHKSIQKNSVLKHPDLIKSKDWEIYQLTNLPSEAGRGIFYIKNPFNERGHLQWTLSCLRDYSRFDRFCIM